MRTVALLRNAWQCSECGDVVESTDVHEMVSCRCGDLRVDRGRDYARFMITRGRPQPRVFTVESAANLHEPHSRRLLVQWLEDLGHGGLDPDRPLDLLWILRSGHPPVPSALREAMARDLATAEIHPDYRKCRP